jgi:hypothetical protein
MSTVETPPLVQEHHRHETGLNTTISRVLTVGLIVAIALLLIGVVLTLARPGLSVSHKSFIRGLPGAIAGLEPDGFLDRKSVV